MLSAEEYGFLIRLASYASFAGIPMDGERLEMITGVSARRARKLWENVKQFFEPSSDGKTWVLSENDCIRPQIVSADRRNLTALLDALVDYWGPRCAYCGSEGELEVEHVVPLARGGTNEITNLTVACRPCNLEKRTKTAAEFGHPDVHRQAKLIQ